MLSTLEIEDDAHESPFQLQRTQAFVLMAIYEFTQNMFSRAWVRSGRAVRSAQLLKLDRLDSADAFLDDVMLPIKHDEGSTAMEEKRRTFWMAYCIDRLFCGIDDMPICLCEDDVSSRTTASNVETNASCTRFRHDFQPVPLILGMDSRRPLHT